MHPLLQYINSYATTLLTEKDFTYFIGHFIEKKIRKKQYLLQEGDICKYMAFILKGSMRKFYVDEKGLEHNVDLYVENWWAGDRESYALLTPTQFNIDACEDCELLLLSRENNLKLQTECPSFNEFRLKLDELNQIANQKRITSTISNSAEKRYADFIERHPSFVQRFPQHIIASYLGITKDTLSRIRKRSLKR
ncbi:Crp/Fnr family transcriptional regulator [Sphingobacterium prati]|uniref:Crp/Fnr family transcriptional regulator n=1 Tax=Sphingobacterium prati TaxID=2737006 RepID=UPI0015530B58|nr:Crp/Fnr family transcriptional regulator [Sphingobacterium prati]NPE45479.1 Crp/Fnr family transcriptional regulator [Sphingobacterium prati]